MNLTDRLRQWGQAHALARSAERSAGPQDPSQPDARRLRQEADRLHREIYRSLGQAFGRGSARP